MAFPISFYICLRMILWQIADNAPADCGQFFSRLRIILLLSEDDESRCQHLFGASSVLTPLVFLCCPMCIGSVVG